MFFLAGLGIDLKEVRGVGDDSDGIGRAVNDLRNSRDMLFTSGGIGPTGVHALYDEGFTEA